MAILARIETKSLLTKTGGYLHGYTHSLNPYAGCSFACSYCYVRRMPVALFREEPWGTWVDAKINAADRLRKELGKARREGPVLLFMSSATDPYQPAEYREMITRGVLEVLAEDPPDFVFVQTRSPLIVRDIDLLRRLDGRLLISITVETDLEPIRRAFAPSAPPLSSRWKAMERLRDAGLPVQAAVAPVLPHTERFAKSLVSHADAVCIDDFSGDGSGGRRTRELNVRSILERVGMPDWNEKDAAERLAEQLRRHFPLEKIRTGRSGFMPIRS